MSCKVLTLSERVEAIKLHDGGKSSRDVAQIMGVGRMQIQQNIKRKSEVLDDYESNIYVIVCILIILYVFVFLFFFSIVIGNKLIKRNYLITFFYYRLITKCN